MTAFNAVRFRGEARARAGISGRHQELAIAPRALVRLFLVASAPAVFGLTQNFLRFDTDPPYPLTHHNDAEGGSMISDRGALVAIAERIAEAENRTTQLRWRVERLRNEGSDASQAIETLHVVSCDLANLYVQQSVMRRTVWAQKCHDQISPAPSHLTRASAHR